MMPSLLRSRPTEAVPGDAIPLDVADWRVVRDLIAAEQERRGEASELADLLVRVESHIPADPDAESLSERHSRLNREVEKWPEIGTGREITRSLEAEQRREAEERKARERGR